LTDKHSQLQTDIAENNATLATLCCMSGKKLTFMEAVQTWSDSRRLAR